MPSAPYQLSSYAEPPSLRRRLTSAMLALGITALIVLMLLTMAPGLGIPEPKHPEVISFGLMHDAKSASAKAKSNARPKKAQTVKSTVKAVTRPASPHVDTSAWPSDMIVMNKADFAAADIATKPNHALAAAEAGGGKGTRDGDSSGNSDGPGGERLYNADWFKRPTSAELGFYMPKTAPPEGWGEIACRTAERYRVEDCRILGESPAGSGFGRAVQNAAWQFKVTPPRAGDKPLIGVWVRIRIDYYQKGDGLFGSAR